MTWTSASRGSSGTATAAVWKCTNCGYKNAIEIRNIYDPDDYEVNGGQPTVPDKFFKALKERTDELDEMNGDGS